MDIWFLQHFALYGMVRYRDNLLNTYKGTTYAIKAD